MAKDFYLNIKNKLEGLKKSGTYKDLRFISSPVSGHTDVEGFGDVVLICSNYLGFADKPGIL